MGDEHGNDAGDRDGAEGASGAERLSAPVDGSQAPRLAFPVVGVGASAGGLEAYTEFLQAAPPDAGMAYVLVQHLPPDRESLLRDLLARQTRMPVLHAEDGQAVEPDHVYVIRPGHTLTLKGGALRLGASLAARGHGRPVDDFFRSLAEEQQQRAVAVVFSGMGSNGTAGAEAVKAVGGLVIAQEPDSAKYPAMPRSLIDAHLPDFILRPVEVPEVLVKYARQPYAADDAAALAGPRDGQALADVLAVLRTRTRHDFSGYRKPTLLRRIHRRMSLGASTSMADYVRTLRQTPAEVTALADDLLIHVTGFFRDPEVWTVLRERVIDPLVAERPDGAEIRCWVSACATGEEAYSLAMLLVEAAEAADKRFDIKVFATDMAERALGSARSGVFPNGIESEVSPERLARFFDKDDSSYRVRKELRELVLFAPQNILQDPPFSRLDVATCRNLLIYLEPATQRRVLALLHFGLREGGALLLGASESAAPAERDFEPIDKRHRLYRRIGPTRSGTLDLPLTAAARDAPTGAAAAGGRPPPALAQLVSRALLDRHTPVAVAVDGVGQIVHVHGDTARYLTLPPGGPTHDLLALANDHVRGAVRSALRHAVDAQAPVTVRDGVLDTPGGRRRVEVGAAPLGPRGGAPLYLVTFRDHPELAAPPASPVGEASEASRRLADELVRVRSELQGALEEMQASNDELKASHEEATSLNEELQSTNDELETSKEEMQSLNEELVTVNAQLHAKMVELEATANDLGSLLTSTDIAVLILDNRLRIRRFTPAVKDLLDLIPSDIGRPFIDLRLKFADPQLLADARVVLDRLIPVERTIESESGRAYLRRILPYRTQDDRIDGVVVAFVDVSERRRTDAALVASEERTRLALDAADLGSFVWYPGSDRGEPDERMLALFDLEGDGRLDLAEALGPLLHPDDRERYAAAVARAVDPAGSGALREDIRVVRSDGSVRWLAITARVEFAGEPRRAVRMPGVAADITEQKHTEALLRASEAKYRTLFESMDEGFCIIEVLYADGRAVDFRFLEANPAFVRHTGISADLGRRVRELVPELEAHWFERYGRVAETGEPMRFEQDTAALGRHYDVFAFRVGAPELRRVAVLFKDVSVRARAETALRASEERKAFLLRLSDALRPLAGPAEIQLTAMRVLGEHLGALRAQYWEVVGPDGAHVESAGGYTDGSPPVLGRVRLDDFGAHVKQSYRAGRTLFAADVLTDPRVTPAELAAYAAIGLRAFVGVPLVKEGRLVAALGVHHGAPHAWTTDEIALVEEVAERTWAAIERANAEAALRVSEARFRTAVDLVPDLMWESRGDGHTDWYNHRWFEYTGQSFEQAAGWGWTAAIHPDDRERSTAAYAAGMASGEPVRHEHRIRRTDGAYRWFIVHVAPVRRPDGELRWYGAATDIHEEREAANRLEVRVAERTAELAAAVRLLEAEVTQRRQLSLRLANAQEDERKRLSRDLHDSVGQVNVALSMALAAAAQSVPLDGEAARRLAYASKLAQEMNRELHDVSMRLRPVVLDDFGLAAALKGLIDTWSAQHATTVDADIELEDRLPAEIETVVFRFVQEALTNVARHARAEAIRVVVARQPRSVTASVEDDGVGFAPGSVEASRLGLRGMQERLTMIGGELVVESPPDGGARITARIPLV